MSLPRIGITMGDPVGVGPEVILKALIRDELYNLCIPYILGDRGLLLLLSRRFSIPFREDGRRIFFGELDKPSFLFTVSHLSPSRLTFGRPEKESSLAAIRYIEEGVRIAQKGEIDALVTCPVNKKALSMAGFKFPGHTEFIAYLTGTEDFAMMMVGGRLRVSLVTIHLPLREAIERLSEREVMKTISLTSDAMKRYFSIPRPRIGVAGLNPHAGEEGLFGREERDIIIPGITKARDLRIDVQGPVSPDTIFYRAYRGEFDCVVALYHDQGLIPIKIVSFGRAVNVTLGLPIIRTSVDHGTAYDIAGRGVADPTSLIEAVRLASQFVKASIGERVRYHHGYR